MAKGLNLDRAYVARALIDVLPWYLDFLAVWMLNYETRRIEAMLREMCDGIAAFAEFSMQPKRVVSFNWSNQLSALLGVGGIFSGAAQAKAAKAQMQAVKLQNDLMSAYMRQAAQHLQQRRSGLEDLLGNAFRGY